MSFFSTDYHEARERFVAAAEAAGLRTVRFRVPHEVNPELFVDFAFVKRNPEKLLVHLSGTHGIEGYMGSAVQSAILAEPVPAGDTSLLFVHAVNPYGMYQRRRANANNVDLNRNYERNRQPNPEYAHFDAYLNPRNRLQFLTGPIGAAFWKMSLGRGRTTQAVASGQYDFPRGLFYMGQDVQREIVLIRDILRSHFPEAKQAIAIDLHSGLGEKGGEMLFCDPDVDPVAPDFFARMFGRETTGQDPSAGNYINQGRLTNALRDSLPRAEWHCCVQEIGTYHFKRVLGALRRENFEWNANGDVAGASEATKREMFELFCPADEAWRERALALGKQRWRQAAEYLC